MSSITLNAKSCTSGLQRSSTICVPPRPLTGSLPGALRTQSGCFSYSSLVVLSISGSIQMPKRMPRSAAALTSPFTPSGNFLLSTIQSPSPALSFTLGYFSPNHPSSMTKSSPPIEAMSDIILCIPSSLILKYTPSQLFSRTLRSLSPWKSI